MLPISAVRPRSRMVVGAAVLIPGVAVAVTLVPRVTPPAVSASVPTVLTAAKDPNAPPVSTRPWKLAFSSDFEGTSLNTRVWGTCYPWACTNAGNSELEWYRPQNVTVAGGKAQLTATATPTNGMPYASGLIQSNGSFNFTYGYAEIRVRFPSGAGLWPAFWMIPQNHTWPPEIDVVETRGDKPHLISENVFVTESSVPYFVRGPNFTAGYHTFGVDWEPHSITWYVDGVPERHINVSINEPMYLVANLAVSGSDPPTASTSFPATLSIAFIRVYQHPPTRRP
jgi:beta-glucanase (GH16 family)